MNNHRRYSEAETDRVIEMYNSTKPNYTAKDIATELGRSHQSVLDKLKILRRDGVVGYKKATRKAAKLAATYTDVLKMEYPEVATAAISYIVGRASQDATTKSTFAAAKLYIESFQEYAGMCAYTGQPLTLEPNQPNTLEFYNMLPIWALAKKLLRTDELALPVMELIVENLAK